MAREVKIVVKNVYAPAEQQQFIVQETTLVQHLKQLVHEQFPGCPLPMHQKLIFGGKICGDTEPLKTILNVNQVQSEECADEAPAVVFHLLVTSVAPRSRPNTPPTPKAAEPTASVPPAAATAPVRATPPTLRHVSLSSDVLSNDRAAIDSPRPVPAAAPLTPPPPMTIGSSTATAATQQVPNHQQTHQHELFTQGMLMHQQALVLTQIQYLQYLQQHAQQSRVAPQPQPQPYNPYGHYGHYFGMGMHHPAHAYHPNVGGAHAAPGGQGHGQQAAGRAPAMPAPGADALPRVAPLPVQLAREVLPLFDLRLAMKMAFMLFIIGQDTPNDRVLMLALLSFVSYLHITGILAKVYDVYKRYYAPAAAAAASAHVAAAAAPHNINNHAAAGANANAIAPAGANNRTRLDFTRVLRISSDRGVVHDVKSFVVGFVLSLVPAWHPQPLHGAAAPPQDLPDVAEMPVQGI